MLRDPPIEDGHPGSARCDLQEKTIAGLEPTFWGINLEDIKAPDCLCVERELRERMKIPVFHADQHGTALRGWLRPTSLA